MYMYTYSMTVLPPLIHAIDYPIDINFGSYFTAAG